MVLRTERNWKKDIEAVSVSKDGTTFTFEVEADQPFIYFKPCLIGNDGIFHWSVGANKLLLMEEKDQRMIMRHEKFRNLFLKNRIDTSL